MAALRETREDVELRVQKAFHMFDLGDKGYLDRHDLKCAIFYLLGIKLLKIEVELLLKRECGVGMRSGSAPTSSVLGLVSPLHVAAFCISVTSPIHGDSVHTGHQPIHSPHGAAHLAL